MMNHEFLFRVGGWVSFLAGVLLTLLGILGLFLPIVPGILFILAGLALMGEKRVHKKILSWLKNKQSNNR